MATQAHLTAKDWYSLSASMRDKLSVIRPPQLQILNTLFRLGGRAKNSEVRAHLAIWYGITYSASDFRNFIIRMRKRGLLDPPTASGVSYRTIRLSGYPESAFPLKGRVK